jgi:hypothetical protein
MIKLWTAGAAQTMVVLNYLSREETRWCIVYGLVPDGARLVVIEWGRAGGRRRMLGRGSGLRSGSRGRGVGWGRWGVWRRGSCRMTEMPR